MPALRILMLEDTPTDAELAERELRKAGLSFTAKRVETRDTFIQALADFQPDIILSDFNLPSFNGMAALEIVRQTHPEIPVIMVTGALRDIDAVELIHAGARDYVLKDRLARLVPAIQHVLSMERGSRARKVAEEALHKSEGQLRLLLNSTAEAIYGIDTHGNCTFCNPSCLRLLGYELADELIGKNMHWLIHHKRPDGTHFPVEECKIFQAFRSGEGTHVDDEVLWRADGTCFPAEYWSYPQYDKGIIVGAVVTFLDITERKRSEEALHKSETLLKQTQQIARVGGWEYDVANKKMYWTDEAYRIHEVDPRDYDPNVADQNMKFYAPGDQNIIDRAFQRAVEWGEPYTLELRFTGARETQKWIRTSAQAEFVAGKVVRVFGSIMDITESKHAEEKMLYLAHYDELTGLPNRTLFRDRMTQEIKKAQRAGLPLALLFIDLDNFKEVNDTLGHDMGDILLVEAARRIGECVRAIDTVARMGGDEFVVILSQLDDTTSIERVASNILLRLAEPFHLKNEIAHVSASIGITLYPDDATDGEALLKNADQAMYAAKEKGRNRYGYFTHAMQEAAQARLRLVNDLRIALSANQFRVYFQPIVDMATGGIYKAEALIRWQHPVRGMVSPTEFIPLAEETGLILEIGDWVFHESVRWAKRWRELYDAEFQVGVNKSPVQFYKDGEEHSAWLAHLRSLDLPGQCLVIEITEGLLLGAEPAITGTLHTLRDAGIKIAIDDFGTGYSSLSYLNKFGIDYLKIDQSFTRNLAAGSSDLALSEAIIVMAHRLGFKVIAEGVETEAQRDLLLTAGCDYAQGYLYSKPLPADEFEVLLKNRGA